MTPNPAGLLSLALYRNLRASAEVGDGVLEPPVAPHTPDAQQQGCKGPCTTVRRSWCPLQPPALDIAQSRH